MEVKLPKSESELQEDPYLLLGYGLNSYYQVMFSLFGMFFWVSVFCFPLYIILAGNGV